MKSTRSKLEIVNNEKHQKLKIAIDNTLVKNSNVHMSHVVVQEIAEVAQYYPIFLSKDGETGRFHIVALFGLQVDENIYQDSALWQECYLPLKLQSQPFYLVNREQNKGPCLAIDVADERVQTQQGNALFDNGKVSAYLKQQSNILAELTKGLILNRTFISALVEHDLIEPIELDIKYNNGEHNKVDGLYTINKTKLEKVPAVNQKQFEQKGYVALVSNMISSLNHVATLIDIKNELLRTRKC